MSDGWLIGSALHEGHYAVRMRHAGYARTTVRGIIQSKLERREILQARR